MHKSFEIKSCWVVFRLHIICCTKLQWPIFWQKITKQILDVETLLSGRSVRPKEAWSCNACSHRLIFVAKKFQDAYTLLWTLGFSKQRSHSTFKFQCYEMGFFLFFPSQMKNSYWKNRVVNMFNKTLATVSSIWQQWLLEGKKYIFKWPGLRLFSTRVRFK